MALYFLTYDLRKKGVHDYQKLYDELKAFNAVAVLESTWCFKRVNTTASSLRDHFAGFVHADDGILVSESGAWATRGVSGNPNSLP